LRELTSLPSLILILTYKSRVISFDSANLKELVPLQS